MTNAHPGPGPTAPADPPVVSGLVLTGERTLPGIPDENYWFQRHAVAYELVAGMASADDTEAVLDAGCGEGYGLALLAERGPARVVGVDLDATVVAHARTTYGARHPSIEVHAAELMDLPLDDDAIDLTVSFQVIEHLYDIPGYLRALRRVTRPGGRVLIATPNRLTFTPGSDIPVNPFHTREFTAAELGAELAANGFVVERLLGVHHGPRLRSLEAATGRPLAELVAAPPPTWAPWLRRTVHALGTAGFEVNDRDLDVSLDLIAVCRVPT